MTPTQLIEVSLRRPNGGRVELAGVVLTIKFFLHGTYRFGFRSNPTDPSGQVVITYDFLEEARLRNLKIQPHDYRTTLEECDPFVEISVPTQLELSNAAEILETMGQGQFRELSDTWRRASNGAIPASGCGCDVVHTVTRCDLVVDCANTEK
jgi:hypothetical protein